MEIKIGDKLVVKNPIYAFNKVVGDIDDIFEVKDVDGYGGATVNNWTNAKNIYYSSTMNNREIEWYFDKYVEPEPIAEEKFVPYNNIPKRIMRSEIEDMVLEAEWEVATVFDCTTIMALKLPNGFVIVETASSADPNKYDEEKGAKICFNKIVDKLWEMETYRLKCDTYGSSQIDTWVNCKENNCDECVYASECFGYSEESEEEGMYNNQFGLDECSNCEEKHTCEDSPYKQ